MDRRLFLSAMLAPLAARTAPLPPTRAGGAVVLGERDDATVEKGKGDDHLTFFDDRGRAVKRVSGLSVSGSRASRRVAVDPARKAVWVCEGIGGRLLRYDLGGKELSAVAGAGPSAVAVDPKTGNAWVACGGHYFGTGHVDVYSPRGVRIARHKVPGHDIALDPGGRGFWVAGHELVLLSPEGKALARRHVTKMCCSALAVDPKVGTVWVGVINPETEGPNYQLKAFGADGRLLRSLDVPADVAGVAVSPDGKAAWVAQGADIGDPKSPLKAVLRYTPDLKARRSLPIPALTLDVQQRTGTVWVVTPKDVRRLDGTGKELSRTPLGAATEQAWIAAW